MENALLNDLLGMVDRFRQNEMIIQTLQNPECVIFVGLEGSENLLESQQVEYIRVKLTELVQTEQNDVWNQMAEFLSVGSPYQ